MRFRGELIITLSRPLEEEILKPVIDELNNSVLKRGARNPEDAAHIETWSIDGTTIKMLLRAGRSVRIDEAALRIKNTLSEKLGRSIRVGIRDLRLINVEIFMDVPISVSITLPYIKEVRREGASTVVVLSELDESEIKKPLLLRLMRLIQDKEAKARWGGKAEHWILLKKSAEKIKEPPLREDPNKILEEAGLMKRMSIGQWLYTPLLVRLINALKELFLDEVVRPLGFEEAIFPKMYPLEVGLKTGHLLGVVNYMVFASIPKSYNVSEFEELIDYMYVYNDPNPEKLAQYLRPPSYFLCFAQCEPFYWFFEDVTLDDSALPIKWYDHSGPSFRWEAGGIHGIERVIEFHRVEVVWLGKPEQVINIRNELLDRYEYFMDKVLDLEWRWAWVTPWFYEHSGQISEELKELDINRPGTIDFEAWLPYRGDRAEHKSWLEIGNISLHGTKFTGPFRVKHNKNETLWTGCSGFGVERWLIAFLAQKGFDPDNWPKKYVEYLTKKTLPKIIKTVTYPPTKEGKELLDQLVNMLSKVYKQNQ